MLSGFYLLPLLWQHCCLCLLSFGVPLLIKNYWKIVTLKSPDTIELSSESVIRDDASVKFDGGYLDPSKGIEVNVGMKTTWSFDSKGSIVSTATLADAEYVSDPGGFLKANFHRVFEIASSYGKTSGDGIVQGFGMITRVDRCVGAVNAGSLTTKSSLAITGSVDGTKSMTGGGEFSADVKGSWKSKEEHGSLDTHLFPSKPDQVADAPAPYAFEFFSFEGRAVLPNWTAKVEPLTLTFDNGHGGTYVVDCELDYDLPEGKQGRQSLTVSGGLTGTMAGIPFEATNLRIKCTFHGIFSNSVLMLAEPKPLGSWSNGRRTIDLKGVWPGQCEMAWREQ